MFYAGAPVQAHLLGPCTRSSAGCHNIFNDRFIPTPFCCWGTPKPSAFAQMHLAVVETLDSYFELKRSIMSPIVMILSVLILLDNSTTALWLRYWTLDKWCWSDSHDTLDMTGLWIVSEVRCNNTIITVVNHCFSEWQSLESSNFSQSILGFTCGEKCWFWT